MPSMYLLKPISNISKFSSLNDPLYRSGLRKYSWIWHHPGPRAKQDGSHVRRGDATRNWEAQCQMKISLKLGQLQMALNEEWELLTLVSTTDLRWDTEVDEGRANNSWAPRQALLSATGQGPSLIMQSLLQIFPALSCCFPERQADTPSTC